MYTDATLKHTTQRSLRLTFSTVTDVSVDLLVLRGGARAPVGRDALLLGVFSVRRVREFRVQGRVGRSKQAGRVRSVPGAASVSVMGCVRSFSRPFLGSRALFSSSEGRHAHFSFSLSALGVWRQTYPYHYHLLLKTSRKARIYGRSLRGQRFVTVGAKEP